MLRFQFWIATLTLLIISGFCSTVFSQSRTTSQLTGLVEDAATGAALPSALIKIESTNLIGGPRTTNCDEQGRFRFFELPPGLYTITSTLAGYKTVVLNGMRLSAGMTTDVPVDMTLHAGDETIVVEAEPKEIDPTSASQPTVLPEEYLKNIPNDRDTSHILDLVLESIWNQHLEALKSPALLIKWMELIYPIHKVALLGHFLITA